MLRFHFWGTFAGRLIVPVILFSGNSCDRRKAQQPGAPIKEATNTPDVSGDPDDWSLLNSLGEEHWIPIEGATEITFQEETDILKIGSGYDLNGVHWGGEIPKIPYEIELEARRTSGTDFFCGMTFPVRDGGQHVTLVVGGWGGNLVGISSVQGLDASENSTSIYREFEDNQWYRIRVRVKKEHIAAWIDDEQLIDFYSEGQALSLRIGPIEDCAPMGLATWQTAGEIRGIRWKSISQSP